GLLRRHIGNCAERRPGTREMLLAHCGRLCQHPNCLNGAARNGYYLCQTEVQNLGMPTVCDKDIRWLDVTVNDAFGMSRVQGICNLYSHGQQYLHVHRMI